MFLVITDVTAMVCNGFCSICSTPCFRGEVKGNQQTISPKLETKLSEVFDAPIESSVKETPPETGLVVLEDIPTYEVKKNIFRKEKTVRVK